MRKPPHDVKITLSDVRRKVFFVGAGISKDPPTCFPLGFDFSPAMISGVAADDPLLQHHAVPALRGIAAGLPGCRPEVLLEIARQGIGNKVLRLLDVLDRGLPNAYHYALASALHVGHVVITTNFDVMIEQAYNNLYPSDPALSVVSTERGCQKTLRRDIPKRLLFKIHGSLRDERGRRSYSSIQFTLASFANGLSPGKRRLLRALLDGRNVIFMGYSGNDDFSVGPYLTALPAAGRFIWAKYKPQPLTFVSSAELSAGAARPDQIDSLIINKGDSYVAEGRTIELLHLLPFFDVRSVRARLSSAPLSDWQRDLVDIIDGLTLSAHQRTRYIAKTLQYNGFMPEAKALLERNAHESKGIEKAIAVDDLAQYHFLTRDFASDLRLRRRARALARRYDTLEALNVVARTWLGAGESYRNTTRYAQALSCFRKAVRIYRRLKIYDKLGYCFAGIVGVHRMRSEFLASERAAQQAARCFRKGRDLPGFLYARWNLAELWKYRGHFGKALRLHQSIRAQAEKMGHSSLIAWALWGEAEVHRLQWRIDEGEDLYTRAADTFPASDLAGRSWCYEGRAQCKFIRDDSPLDDIERALRGFESLRAVIGKATATLDRVTYALKLGGLGEAEAALRELRPLRLPPKDSANVLLVSAELNGLRGSKGRAKSKSLYDQALRKYHSLGMRHAFVSATVLRALRHGGQESRLRSVRLKARAGSYTVELEAIDTLLSGDEPVYKINLS